MRKVVSKLMTTKLFVGGLAWETRDDSLKNFFSTVGTVVSANVIIDKYTDKSKGFGFVEMSSEKEAEEAKTKLNGQALDGRNISISDARPQQPREERPQQ
ncbi:MAG: RNP-1 like protein RNA-binding protein, Glycine-rich [Candidatus Woesebacteria bacterium GW2011_GWC1_38_13]|uniref:RNP-1 like protein RNA-binding protein, Glycine-rich n=4 Tax=Candidatus Woeseibacteriota TaxID=1752722 RepID=A0A0G0N9H4_9BACT|nr:MAG: RNP-1 like protein RNA-binding protein, Glycine-rich [Candidatus Woesebacteria bacterium GW2011_GWD1_38_10]KKQ55986.1 MAG: RNP-1 like protein RNA-binding protein, Glycine-rich [Candidatus Woesebacteria bacterium GW2011_GWC1_38_13]KKQ82549.1 MAG: RNP-1 like protein RNA-binding protein, Glycine-rich [Candidatus Woesebacteria bacterium GW2011_GWA1_38_8]